VAGFATLDLFLVPNVNKYPFAGSKPTLLQEKKKPNPQSSAIQNQGATVDGEARLRLMARQRERVFVSGRGARKISNKQRRRAKWACIQVSVLLLRLHLDT